MAQGKPRTQKVAEDAIGTTEGILPDLVGESFASYGLSRSGTGRYGGLAYEQSYTLEDMDNPYSIVNDSYVSARDMINICRKAYRRVAQIRTAIDIMTDLANTPIHLEGGNAQSVEFFKAWLKRINDFHVKDQVFREIFLSGTVILERIDAQMSTSEIFKLNQNYADKKVSIPTKYILLDSAGICLHNFAFDIPTYYKIMNAYELDRLKRSEDENDQEAYKSIRKRIEAFSNGIGQTPIVKLDPNKIHTVFYQKQDYQPFPIPMAYSVIDDVKLLLELKRADSVMAKAVDYALLLVTMGEEKMKGGTDPKALNAMKALFNNGKLGRVLVSDYTTEAKFVSPELDKLLSPVKYEEVDKNIANGMMNIFFGEQKYADSITKLKALTRKIELVQELFLRDFLNPEIKRISKQMNFKSYPVARMEPIRIEDQTNTQRIYAQLIQMGILTAEDAVDLWESGLFPEYKELEERQVNFRKQKDKGLFQPVQGGPFDTLEQGKQAGDQAMKLQKFTIENAPKPVAPAGPAGPGKTPKKAPGGPGGRPPGTKAPQTTKKVSQTGAEVVAEAQDELLYSQKTLAENTIKLIDAKDFLKEQYKRINNVKRLNQNHRDRIDMIGELLFENESPEDWNSKAESYLTDLASHAPNPEVQMEIEEIKEQFEVDHEAAILLYHSRID
jgi:hypothetical protein